MKKTLIITLLIVTYIACFYSGYRTHEIYVEKSAPRYPSAEAAAVDQVFTGITKLYDAGATDVCLYGPHLGYRIHGEPHIVYADFNTL